MIIKITNNNLSLFAPDKYSLSYEVGKVTEKIPGTLGIFCYDTVFPISYIFDIEKELLYAGYPFKNIKVFEVKGIGESRRGLFQSSILSEASFDWFYRNLKASKIDSKSLFNNISYPHVIIYDSIKVIKEIPENEIKSYFVKTVYTY